MNFLKNILAKTLKIPQADLLSSKELERLRSFDQEMQKVIEATLSEDKGKPNVSDKK